MKLLNGVAVTCVLAAKERVQIVKENASALGVKPLGFRPKAHKVVVK